MPGRAQLTLQDLLCDDDLLNLVGTLVDSKRAHVAIESLHDLTPGNASSAKKLHGAIADSACRFRREPLRHRRLAGQARSAEVLQPSGTINQQGAGIDIRSHRGDGGL